MARMPGAQWQGEHGVTKMSAYRRVCIHTIVGNPPAHAAHFSTAADGTVYQSRDTAWQSAANYQGNHDTIAIENDDHGSEYGAWSVNDGHAVPGFTTRQAEAIANILVWAHKQHGVPLTLCPGSRPGSVGVAYHRQGIDGSWAGYAYGGRAGGGEKWSKSGGKVCPGDRRISQLINEIIPRARYLAGLDQPIEEESEMSKVFFVHGDSTTKVPGKNYNYGDALFMVVSDADGTRRRHMHPDEWACLAADGAKAHTRSQNYVDSIPWGAQPGLEPWVTGGPIPGTP